MSKITVQTLGTLTVTGPCGEVLTPRGAKVGGLLALLAVARGRWCTRAWLQDKLWSDRGQRQGQDSLRHAIADLRSALGDHASALRVEGRNLALDRDRALVDLYDPLPRGIDPPRGDASFLAGIDIRDREFEAWLREMRSEIGERPVQRSLEEATQHPGFHVALLPIEAAGGDARGAALAASIAARVMTSLTNLGPFAVYDFSDGVRAGAALDDAPDAFLIFRPTRIGETLSASFALRRASDNKVIWSLTQTIALGSRVDPALSALVIQVTDQIARVLYRPGVLGPAERHQAARFALAGIDRMFSLASGSLGEADVAFARATEIEPNGTYFAWHAYLTVFRLGELPRAEAEDLRAFAASLAERALALDGHNPLTLALLTQVYAFVFRDYEKARGLIEPAIAASPDSLMALDSLALLNFYTDHIDEARRAATRAMDAAIYNPYRYCFATTLCMVETVAGNHERAIEHGERALALHRPGTDGTFAPVLRYLTAAYERSGRVGDALRTQRALVAREPDLDAARVAVGAYPLPNRRARTILAGSLRRLESRGATADGPTLDDAGRARAAVRPAPTSGDHR